MQGNHTPQYVNDTDRYSDQAMGETPPARASLFNRRFYRIFSGI